MDKQWSLEQPQLNQQIQFMEYAFFMNLAELVSEHVGGSNAPQLLHHLDFLIRLFFGLVLHLPAYWIFDLNEIVHVHWI